METLSTLKKVVYFILSIIFTVALLYGTYTILFVAYMSWVGNLIMFYLNVWTLLLILFAMMAAEEDREKVAKNKSLPVWVHVTSTLMLMLMFAAAGWIYYAILCLIMSFFEYGLYSHKTKGIER